MARTLDDLIIKLQLRTTALEQGLREAKKQLNNHGRDIKAAGKSYDELAIVAGAAFYKIAQSISSGIDAYNQSRNALVGLQSIAEGTGNSFASAQKYIENYTNDGLIPAANAATALKNLLSRGYTETQAIDVLNRLKDAAAFGRQASLQLGDAVASATEGLKNENSILVDNAGVTKNVSVMWKEYAEAIGKSVNDLTTAEKIQAEYAGIMKETRYQVGDAAKYSAEFAGQQAKASKASFELSKALGGSMVPSYSALYAVLTPIKITLAELIEEHPILSSTIIATATAATGAVVGIVALTAAFAKLKPAITAVTVSMASNPVILALTVGLTALVAVITLVTGKLQQARKAQEEYTAAVKEHQKIVTEGAQEGDIQRLDEENSKLTELAKRYTELNDRIKVYNQQIAEINSEDPIIDADAMNGIRNARIEIEKIEAEMKKYGATASTVNKIVEENKRAMAEAAIGSSTQYNEKLKTIALQERELTETRALISAYQNAEVGSSQWYTAQKKLSDLFPQFSSASGIAIESIINMTEAKQRAADADWKLVQAEVTMTKIKLQGILSEKIALADKIELAEKARTADIQWQNGKPVMVFNEAETQAGVKKYKDEIKSIQDEINTLNDLLAVTPGTLQGISVADTSEDTALKSYENAALTEHMRYLDHRKKLNDLSLEEELNGYEWALKAFAFTAEEKMDLEEKVFETREAIRERDKQSEEDALQYQEDAMRRRTDNSLNWIAEMKANNQLNTDEETAAYGRIIDYHKQYLDQILTDERRTQDEKDRIRVDEESFIRTQQEKILQIYQEYAKKQEDIMRQKSETAMNWLDSAKFYDTISQSEEIKTYEQLIINHKEYLDQILADEKISQEDKSRILENEIRTIRDFEQRKNTIQKQFLEQSIDDYIDAELEKVSEAERIDEESFEKRRRAIENEYDQAEEENQAKSRAQKLAELESQKQKYVNAATKDGKEKLAEIMRKIDDIQQEEATAQREQEKKKRLEELDDEQDKTMKSYEQQKKDLETQRSEYLKGVQSFLNEVNTEYEDNNTALSNALGTAMKTFETNQETARNNALVKVREFVRNILNEYDKIKNIDLGGIITGNTTAAGVGMGNVIINDYGDKNLIGVNDINAYGREIVNAGKDELRVGGG